MSDSKSYKLTKADLFVSDGKGGETKQNIVDLIGEFTWYESIVRRLRCVSPFSTAD